MTNKLISYGQTNGPDCDQKKKKIKPMQNSKAEKGGSNKKNRESAKVEL